MTSSQTRRRAFTKRSRTGCRTCRIRHVKCDEAPGGCRNCISNGWSCEGSELNRLPRHRDPTRALLSAPSTGFRWAMTPDEKRCVSFFLHRTIPSLTSYYDSSLWQKTVLHMCGTEPAVYHAVVALSAVNQDLERYGIPVPGTAPASTWHRFALDQSMRSFSLLTQRHVLQDPQLKEVVLVCCLLFVMLDLASGRIDEATAHLHSGLSILTDMNVQCRRLGAAPVRVEEALLEAFLQLGSQATLHGYAQPLFRLDDIFELDQTYSFQNLQDVQQALGPLVNNGLPFIDECWNLPESEIIRLHGALHSRQMRLLSRLDRFGGPLNEYLETAYGRLTQKEQRGADMIKVTYLTMLLTIKTCLYTQSDREPVCFLGEYKELLSASLAAMDKFQDHPMMTMDTTICLALFTVAARCPDYGLRLQAIKALRAWPHCEGYLNSVFLADLVMEGMKRDLRQLWQGVNTRTSSLPPGSSFQSNEAGVLVQIHDKAGGDNFWISLNPNHALAHALSSIQSARRWACVKAYEILLA
ncbi:hypothetical protein BJX99DRAFT_219849 [Aspergillus californicus]